MAASVMLDSEFYISGEAGGVVTLTPVKPSLPKIAKDCPSLATIDLKSPGLILGMQAGKRYRVMIQAL